MENKKDIGKAFREKLDGLQKSPSNAVWDSIRADLPKKRNRFLFLFWSNATQVTKTLMIAALLALVTTASYFIYDNYSDANNTEVNNSDSNNASGTAPSGTYDNSNASGNNNNNTGNTTTGKNNNTNNNADATGTDVTNPDGDSNSNAAKTNGNNSNNASTISGSGNSNGNNSGRASSSKDKNNNGVAGSNSSASDNNNTNTRGTSKNNKSRNAASKGADNANGKGAASAKANINNRNNNKTAKNNSGLVNAKNGADDSSTGTSTANNNRNTKTGKTGRKTTAPGTNSVNNRSGALTVTNGTTKGNNAKGENGNNNSGNTKSGNALSSISQGKTGGVSGIPVNGNGTDKSNTNSGTTNNTIDSNNTNSNTNNTNTVQNNEGTATATDSLNNVLKNSGIALKDSIAPAIDSLAIAMAKDSATICEPTIDDAKKADSTATAPYKKWYVFAHAAPTKYNLPGGTSLIDPTLNGNATTLSSSFNYGIYAGYNFSPKLSVRLGIIKAGLEQTTKNASLFSSYSVVPGNTAEPNGYVELQLPENYSGINYRSGVSNAGVMQQLRTQQDTVTVNIRHKLELYEVPIEATYTLFGKKVGLSITAGASGIFVKQNTVYAQNAQGSVLLGSLKGINKVSFSGNVGLSFYYRFMPALQVNVEPVFKYYFNTFDAIKPTSLGLQIGLQYNFDIGKQKK